ncbi:ABC transporter substrate-binding protein [Pelolinea submarina]|uniref:ABC-type nitrate/sulfonate/bicarbonate transport system substrate-binding protein n=1 Tax=Pelolinea submarina TaxID=913107 RepID=A0A347ZW12_9CHLR|nr:NrtA/SsuA/CpmA family ABC transporter substrate-binding protein [Pelolinea submarina]REG07189.1 ABC-type nitrate/sulfonate/bicarbonate transport system substrate-binding protein [Pelolinea submarina]BBB49493.1 sulfonate transport system substrate-binding protein [Pelolinea submarina]
MFKHKSNLLNFSIAIILVGMLILTACGSSSGSAKSEMDTVKYGGQLYPEEYLLKGQDFWSKYGLTVQHTLFSSGGENNQALISNAIDINIGSDSKSVELFNAMGDKVVIIAASQRGDRYSTMVQTDSGITSWYDMKGETVGIRLGTGAEQVVRRYFEAVGDLSWDDFNWVDLKVEDMAAALADGSIASFTAWEPTPAIAEATGNAQVMMSYGDYALTPVLIHTSKAYAESHHDELVAFLKGQLDKVDMIQNNPDEAARIAAEAASAQGSEVAPEVFKTIFERVDFSLDVDDEVLAALNDTAQFLKDQGSIDTIPEFYVDMSFLKEAEESR